MTPEWKALVLAELEKRGKDIPWLAEQIGISRSAGYKMFAVDSEGNMVQTGSADVPTICELLDLPPPLVANPAVTDTKDGRIMELVRHAGDDLKDGVIAFLSAALKR